jgi:hypothetical protein
MSIERYEFETSVKAYGAKKMDFNPEQINEKYEKGASRVVTESGSYKVAHLKTIFDDSNYDLHPDYQRRITWNTIKRSKLIESLIINIPIPPIFLYEYDYDKYEIMDGLQRISAIIDFYNDEYPLRGLEEWSELNGKKYSKLPEKIKEGIDRRQIQYITLLKETAADEERADSIKRLVFERLNTGGVKLLGQEIRNAIFNGPANKLCVELSENEVFRTLWSIPNPKEFDGCDLDLDEIEDRIRKETNEKILKKLEKHSLYKRMYDVELVLRYFAMRHLDEFNYGLSDFLDDTLVSMNHYTEEQLNILRNEFQKVIVNAYNLFDEYAFKIFDGSNWSSPSKMIYDPMMIVLSNRSVGEEQNKEENIKKLRDFYLEHLDDNLFDGKHQSKEDIEGRVISLSEFITGIL